MAKSKLAQALESHPDKRTLKIAGEERDFLPGVYGFRLAKKQGIEVDFGALGRSDPVAFADYLYAGLLPFDPDLDYDLFSAMLSADEIGRLVDELGEGEEKGGAEGN